MSNNSSPHPQGSQASFSSIITTFCSPSAESLDFNWLPGGLSHLWHLPKAPDLYICLVAVDFHTIFHEQHKVSKLKSGFTPYYPYNYHYGFSNQSRKPGNILMSSLFSFPSPPPKPLAFPSCLIISYLFFLLHHHYGHCLAEHQSCVSKVIVITLSFLCIFTSLDSNPSADCFHFNPFLRSPSII